MQENSVVFQNCHFSGCKLVEMSNVKLEKSYQSTQKVPLGEHAAILKNGHHHGFPAFWHNSSILSHLNVLKACDLFQIVYRDVKQIFKANKCNLVWNIIIITA